jgi:hypothetical protein
LENRQAQDRCDQQDRDDDTPDPCSGSIAPQAIDEFVIPKAHKAKDLCPSVVRHFTELGPAIIIGDVPVQLAPEYSHVEGNVLRWFLLFLIAQLCGTVVNWIFYDRFGIPFIDFFVVTFSGVVNALGLASQGIGINLGVSYRAQAVFKAVELVVDYLPTLLVLPTLVGLYILDAILEGIGSFFSIILVLPTLCIIWTMATCLWGILGYLTGITFLIRAARTKHLISWLCDTVQVNRIQLVYVRVGSYNNRNDSRAEFERDTRLATQNIIVYKPLIEVKLGGFGSAKKYRYYDDPSFFGYSARPLVSASGKKFELQFILEGLLPTFLNKRTIYVNKNNGDACWDRAIRLAQNNTKYDIDLALQLETGHSVFLETAHLCSMILCRDTKTDRQHF